MKTKPVKQRASGRKHQKEKPKNILLNSFGVLALIIPLTWAAIGIYNYEKEGTEEKKDYEASLPGIEKLIDPNKVCMATDAFMNGHEQIVVPNQVGNFYACSQPCISTIQLSEVERYAIDPVSKNRISKATAFICLHPDRSGKVCYFETKENHLAFIKIHKNER
ncbi:MAG: hypothetical protein O9262_02190 [Cyclobacteriaceae bacterium]|nr:hypothetical protein [Cyclobacteriaceae bacterium]